MYALPQYHSTTVAIATVVEYRLHALHDLYLLLEVYTILLGVCTAPVAPCNDVGVLGYLSAIQIESPKNPHKIQRLFKRNVCQPR